MSTTTTSVEIPQKRKRSTAAYVAIALGFFAITIVLFYLEENWRGKQAWSACKAELQAKGILLDWQKLIPEPVPDDQNIFKAAGMDAFVKGHGQSHLSDAISNVGDKARQTERTNILLAKITVLPDQPSNQGNSLAEMARTINQHARVMPGASGILLFPGRILREPPLNLNLPGQIDSVQKELTRQLEHLDVRAVGENHLEVSLAAGISAEDYINAFEAQKPGFDSLKAALHRPFARMEGDYSVAFQAPIQNFVALRSLAQTASQAAQSYLLLKKPDEALDAVTLIYDSQRLITAQPARKSITLVSAMINVAINGLYTSVIADGLKLDLWGDNHLATLQSQLATIDLLPVVRDSLDSELIAVTYLCEKSFSQIPDVFKSVPISTGSAGPEKISLSKIFDLKGVEKAIVELVPSGWGYQNIVKYAELMQVQLSSLDSLPRVQPRTIETAREHLQEEIASFSPFLYVARMAIPNTGKALQTATKNQTLAQLAQVACALERFRSSHREYPSKLAELSPGFIEKIPPDLITGQPPIYRRTDNGSYLLYAVGWNEKDDGGTTKGDFTRGDIVWNGLAQR